MSLRGPRNHELFDLGDSLSRIKALWTGVCAAHNGVTPIEAEWTFKVVQAFAGSLISAIHDPTICLQQDGRTEITVAVPPVTWTTG